MNQNQRIYNSLYSGDSREYRLHSAGSLWYMKRIERFIVNYLNDKNIATLADLGCGDGTKTEFIASLLPEAQVDGYDFSEEGITSARTHSTHGNVHFYNNDVTEIAKKYDVISAFEVIEHIDDYEQALENWLALKPKYVLLGYPAKKKMHKNEPLLGHVRNYPKGVIEKFMEDHGYTTVAAHYAGFPFYSPICSSIQFARIKTTEDTYTPKMSKLSEFIHYCVFILFDKFSTEKHLGKAFMGLWENKN